MEAWENFEIFIENHTFLLNFLLFFSSFSGLGGRVETFTFHMFIYDFGDGGGEEGEPTPRPHGYTTEFF